MDINELPAKDADFLKVSGVGFTKLTKYGDEFLIRVLGYLLKH